MSEADTQVFTLGSKEDVRSENTQLDCIVAAAQNTSPVIYRVNSVAEVEKIGVITCAAGGDIITKSTDKYIIAIAAIERVCSDVAIQDVITTAAVEGVVAIITVQEVIAVFTAQNIVT